MRTAHARRASSLLALALAVAGCTDTPPSAPASPTDTEQPGSTAPSPTPFIDYAAGLPGIGDEVEVPGEDVSITLIQVVEWPEPAFLALAGTDDRCGAQPGDAFVALELRFTFASPEAEVLSFGLLVGPPRGSPAYQTQDPYRNMVAEWCMGPGGPWDDGDVPQPNLRGISIWDRGEGEAEGWLLFPIRPDIAESGQAILAYLPRHTADITEIRLR